MTRLDFQLIIIITVTIQVAVLNRFSWNSHGWSESAHGWTLFFFFFFFFFLKTSGSIEPLIWRKMCPQNWFFGFYSAIWGWGKNFKTYSVPHFHIKVYIDFCRQTPAFPLWMIMSPTNRFSQIFQHKLKNIREVFLLGSILIQKKILWRINFVLIKFLPNALLFEKLQNECKNSFLHKVTCVRSDHTGAVAQFYIHGFVL